MIQIRYQDAFHQYDGNYNPITSWDDSLKEWVVNAEYEEAYKHNEIDWGSTYNFPRGILKKKLYENIK